MKLRNRCRFRLGRIAGAGRRRPHQLFARDPKRLLQLGRVERDAVARLGPAPIISEAGKGQGWLAR
jgi:hypothetical protein